MALIKKIEVSGATYDIADEYARKRLEGLSTVYSISCEYAAPASGMYVDWDTEETVTITSANIKNSLFKSTDDTITVSGTGSSGYYLVLQSKSGSNNYAKKMANMQVGDTIYVIEALTVAADRWLSSFTVGTGTISAEFKALNEKIDLSEYALKTEAGKAGTYTPTIGSTVTGNTGSGGAQTATGSATISYDKADAATSSAGAATVTTSSAGNSSTIAHTGLAGGHDVEGSNFTFNGTAATINVSNDAVTLDDHSYTPAGTISAVSAASHSHTVNVSKSTITNNVTGTATGAAGKHSHQIDVSGDITIGDLIVSNATSGTATYTPQGSVASHSHSVGSTTASINEITSAGELPDLTITDKTVVTGGSTAAVLTGVKASGTTNVVTSYPGATSKLVTDTISGVSGSTTASKATAGTATVYGTADVGTATTVATGVTTTAQTVATSGLASVSASGTNNFNTDAYKVDETELANGILKLVSAATASAITGITSTAASTASVIKTVSATTTTITPAKAADTTRKFTPYTFTDITVPVAASAKTVATGALSATGSGATVMTGLGTASTASVVTGVAANGTTNAYTSLTTATVGSASGWAAGSLPTFSGKTVVTAVNANTGNTAPVFTGTGARLLAAAGTVHGEMAGMTDEVDNHTHTLTNSKLEYVSSATTSIAGGFTVTPTFTGTAASISHSFTDTTVAASMSGSYTPEGTISGYQTVADHSHTYTKPAAHTHSVTIASHTHSIGSTSTSVTGTASVAVSSHTHSIGNHTHASTVTIPAIKST